MTSDTITVLLVDDDSSLSELVAEFLERESSRLRIFSEPSAEAGLERVQQDAIDCIVSDYEMPGMDGLEFLKVVRAEYPDFPFILYTGKGSEEIAENAINAGVDAYYQKETGTGHYTVLANQITTLVEKHTAEQRLTNLEREKHMVDGGVSLDDEISTGDHNESLSMTAVRAIASREGIDPVALTPPLYESINPEALDSLFPQQAEGVNQDAGSVTFTHLGYTITISADGQVTLER